MASIVESLEAEWSRLVASPGSRRAIRKWGSRFPALAGCADLDAVLERRRDPERVGPVLQALAALAPGDELAARVLLQALLPGLVCLGARHRAQGGVDEVHVLLGEGMSVGRPHRRN